MSHCLMLNVRLPFCLAIIFLTVTGCGRAPNAKPAATNLPAELTTEADVPPTPEVEADDAFVAQKEPARKSQDKKKATAKNNDPPKNPFIRSLYDELDRISSDDLSGSERDKAKQDLRDADVIYTRVKEQNKEALKKLKNPPKYHPPTSTKKSETKTTEANEKE